MEVKGGNQ